MTDSAFAPLLDDGSNLKSHKSLVLDADTVVIESLSLALTTQPQSVQVSLHRLQSPVQEVKLSKALRSHHASRTREVKGQRDKNEDPIQLSCEQNPQRNRAKSSVLHLCCRLYAINIVFDLYQTMPVWPTFQCYNTVQRQSMTHIQFTY